ncbi:MAG: dihydrofolate reductase family protein [Verrucomicrobiae bacterium]|nr:dihydrofolate reductase family protein [Verrucomicrobiae bacterium]
MNPGTATLPAPPDPPSRQRPFLLVNMAMTADGKIATANRVVGTFGSRRDHAHLLALRATADAILCGAGTVNLPGITLGPGGPRYRRLRHSRGLATEPLRIVVSGQARLRPDADLFLHPGSPIQVWVSANAPTRRVARLQAAGAEVLAFGGDDVDLAAALSWLARQHRVRRVVAEGGALLNDALFRAGLVDELHLTLCPLVFGGRTAPTLANGRGFPSLADAARFHPPRVRRAGNELFLVFRAILARGPDCDKTQSD